MRFEVEETTAPVPESVPAPAVAPGIRIAMWSGPRNISTAMMRSWGNRADTFVCDEPLYAHYLLHRPVDHPGREEVIDQHETDWRKVVEWLTTGPVPEGKAIYYQKHMAHHLLANISRGWLGELRHAFLIREPGAMLASLAKVMPEPGLMDTGLPQQVELFEEIMRRTGKAPPVVDAEDVLADPRGVLTKLCAALGVKFDEAMLSWPAGKRKTDGVWAKHWYESVEKSTGFERGRRGGEAEVTVSEELRRVLEECVPMYERLHAMRLR